MRMISLLLEVEKEVQEYISMIEAYFALRDEDKHKVHERYGELVAFHYYLVSRWVKMPQIPEALETLLEKMDRAYGKEQQAQCARRILHLIDHLKKAVLSVDADVVKALKEYADALRECSSGYGREEAYQKRMILQARFETHPLLSEQQRRLLSTLDNDYIKDMSIPDKYLYIQKLLEYFQ